MVYKNLALSTVATAPSPATTGTSLVLAAGEGARFPQPSTDGVFYITAFPVNEYPHLGNAEILKVTARSTDTLTIVREQYETTAKTIIVGFVILQGIYSEDFIGQNFPVINEVPTGTVNGSNTVFDTATTYVAGSIQVYRDGQLMKGAGADYTETDNNTITFVTAPITDSVLLVTYQHTVSTTGNADTVDGYHANATPTANNIPVLDSNALLPVVALPTFYAADAEATDTYAITLSPVPAAYTTGMVVRFKANTKNTGAATINVNALGAKSIVKNFNVVLVDSDIRANQITEIIYDGTNFQLISPASSGMSISTSIVQTQIVSSTTEADLFTFSVPANLLGTNRIIRARVMGRMHNQSGGAYNLTFRLKYGATILDTRVRSVLGDIEDTGIIIDLWICNNGATNSQKGGFGAVEGTDNNTNLWSGYGTSAEDSTGALTFKITAQLSVNHASASISNEASIVEIF